MHHGRSKWVIVDRSGRFWMVVQGKEKRKKINKVQHLPKRGHDTSATSSCFETDQITEEALVRLLKVGRKSLGF